MSETTITVIENPRSGGELRARRTWVSKSDVKKIIDGRTPTVARVVGFDTEPEVSADYEIRLPGGCLSRRHARGDRARL